MCACLCFFPLQSDSDKTESVLFFWKVFDKGLKFTNSCCTILFISEVLKLGEREFIASKSRIFEQ